MSSHSIGRRPGRLVAILVFLALSAATAAGAGPRVLLLWDSMGAQTESLKRTLESNSVEVVLSQTAETGFDGTNPSLDGIDVVVHLNGTTYNSEMTKKGQAALVAFVEAGGGYVHHEWNAYQLSQGQMTAMRDLILFDRRSGYSGKITVQRLEGQAGHPVVWEVPSRFEIEGGCNIGQAHAFAEHPVTVLARDNQGNAAIAVREFGLGRIVGFHHAGNWSYTHSVLLDKREARRLFVDAVMWAHGCGPAFAKGARKEICARIARDRGARAAKEKKPEQ